MTTLAGERRATARYTTEPAVRATAAALPSPSLAGARWLNWLESRRGRQVVYSTLAVQVALVAVFAAVYRPFDLAIYLWGGRAVTEGTRLYLLRSHGNWFTYPPFAAALFTPLAAVPAILIALLWEFASVAALAWASALTLRLAGVRLGRTVLAAMVAAALLLEPMYHTLYLGQVNLFLMAIVLADLWRAACGRPTGIGTGIATAIKLTPGIFIVVLLLTRRGRDAVIATITFACCGIIGFVVDPGASRLYWTHLFYDTSRVGAAYISNQSPYAAVVRILGGTGHVGTWYDVVPVVLGGVGVAVAATLGRRGDWLGVAAATGITGLLVSPISWTHHWVWVLPALVVLLRADSRARVAAACGFAIFVLAPLWWTPHAGVAGDYGARGAVTAIANCFLIAGLAFMVYMVARTWRPRSDGVCVALHGGVLDYDSGAPVASKAPASEWIECAGR